ncbi:hypothetical protein D7B24_004729 [Verticillium nonalfalfae]|uniref:Uncharacterized protein n=1 Tax=Verticillium nonalfalfae TaxID=1051616 RepID=A0A3M9YH66_9PEZI|nr:uncharacterized protein D7B24_004729 [Verticillium nonalfalfae]RNJ58460.1 hypothetical protein D7B24_004729 [Verticillium nonalfalfae]
MTSNGDTHMPPRGASPPIGSPRSLSVSLQAAATLNAGIQREHDAPRQSTQASQPQGSQSPTGRRRSAVLMNLHLNDPALPGPGEMVAEEQPGRHNQASSPNPSAGVLPSASPQPISSSPHLIQGGDPHHNRAPSLGELHQELEAEQEAQVNRLLHTIREQQLQLQQLREGGPDASAADDSAIASERSQHGTPTTQHAALAQTTPVPPVPTGGSFSRSPGIAHHPRSSFDMARADLRRRSRTPSRGPSPRLRATSISGESDQLGLGGRDENAFYQAETQTLVRENQMLRHRIRDLERQLADATPGSPSLGNPNEPAQPSNLTRATSIDEEKPTASISDTVTAGETPKQ